MSDVIAVLAGIGAILWVNWYFLASPRAAAEARIVGTGAQEVEIRVEGGYEPAHVRVRRGTPVRLILDRRETASCSEEIVLPEYGIRRFLPPHEKTVVEFTPTRAGTFDFTCGMSMLRGRITVEEEGRS